MFNPAPVIQSLPVADGAVCHIVDDALLEPVRWQSLAARHAHEFELLPGNAYPGPELRMPQAITDALHTFLIRHLGSRFGLSRSLSGYSRLAMVTWPPQQLQPWQWICHRDRLRARPDEFVLASVLYLFHDPGLGGTAFYRARRSEAETERMVHDSVEMPADQFAGCYGIEPGYLRGSNDWFERVLSVPPRWNRLIAYDGSRFHCSDIAAPDRLSDDPALGRLTLNGFFTCLRAADGQ